MARLYLIRGLPGSGKSTYAKTLGCFHVEADMFHVRGGEYRFDPAAAKTAHNLCQRAASAAMSWGMDVAVSNTFTQRWEMQPYIEAAEALGVDVIEHVCTGGYGTVHNVPAEVVEKMRGRWED